MSEPILHADVAIVGSGPAGMAAARDLCAFGLSVVVLDENHGAGGQIFRQPRTVDLDEAHRPGDSPSHARGQDLLRGFLRSGARLETGAVVWDAAPGRVWFEQRGESRLVRCRDLVLATGAHERAIPFPGWTLPGVVTLGAAQIMTRGFDLRPGSRALVAGSGPLLLPTIAALAAKNVEVVAALEACRFSAAVRALPGILWNAARRREARYYLGALRRARKRLSWGSAVFAAKGEGRVERAVIGRVDRRGRPLRETAREIEVDLVCAGFGLVPAFELGKRIGCALAHDEGLGGFHIATDETTLTSVPHVHAAGEAAGIGGSEVAIAEGRLAAAAILHRAKGVPIPRALVRDRIRERGAARALLSAFALPRGLYELAEPDTIVCRCEDVTLAEVREAGALFGGTLRGIKMGCRAGMGACQGRICGMSLQELVESGRGRDEPSVQMPVKPVATDVILNAPAG
ncbi:MAG: NAD(P)/FAD-dependent oxidoreductase [Planctomycetota bacterium]